MILLVRMTCVFPDLSVFVHVLHTGHLDGTLCLWDLRQNKAGGQPLAEVRLADWLTDAT
jgi:hypothetical protein